MASPHYANNTCRTCGRRILLRRPEHDKDKLDHERATLWIDLQRKHAVNCVRCSKNIRFKEMKKIEARIDMSGIEE